MATIVESIELSPSALRSVASRLIEAGERLRAMQPRRRARALSQAADTLRDPTSLLGRRARETLPSRSGLSPEMVEWGLETTLREVDEAAIVGLVGDAERIPGGVAQPARLALVVLSSNLFTAPVRAIGAPLALGVPVLAKGSTRDDVFARLFEHAIKDADAEVGAAYELLTFAGARDDLLEAAFAEADVVSVYGSDATIAGVGSRLPTSARLIAHGHGVGAAFLPADSLGAIEQAKPIVEALSLDIAAYDQRGCLSPHWVMVEEGGTVTIEGVAELLFEALGAIATKLPRAPLSTRDGALQMQWRGVARARGTLLEGDGFAIALEPSAAPRFGPGARNVALLSCRDRQGLFDALLPFGRHLKALGVGADEQARLSVARELPSPLAPLVSATGTMQMPPFDAPADGLPPWAGLIRSVGAR